MASGFTDGVLLTRRSPVLPALGLTLSVLVVLTGCGAAGEGDAAAGPRTGSQYEVVPEPGRTIAPAPPEAAEEGSLVGYRMAVVVPDDSGASSVMLDAVHTFARGRGAELTEVRAATEDEGGVSAALAEALAIEPDLVIGLGEPVADVFSFETAQWLSQQFLVVGAQLAEPTENVTAVIWDGATSRGSAATADGALDDASVTPARAAAAAAAGVTSVRAGITGVVLDLDRSTSEPE